MLIIGQQDTGYTPDTNERVACIISQVVEGLSRDIFLERPVEEPIRVNDDSVTSVTHYRA
jgi:hypothetical protein